MAKISQIISKLENIAPPELAEPWDNSGWQLFLGDEDCHKVLIALSVTADVVDQAISLGCSLIISHHPMIFSAFKSLNLLKNNDDWIIKCIKNNISVYSSHTNFDSAPEGVAFQLAKAMGLSDVKEFSSGDKIISYMRTGEYKTPILFEEFISNLKKNLNLESVRIIGSSRPDFVRKVCVCPGSGADMVSLVKDFDIFVTSDVKYHSALDAHNVCVIDAGHYQTEQIALKPLKDMLAEVDAEFVIAEEKAPWVEM